MRPFTDKEWDELPHVILTHKNNWDPCVLNHAQSDDQDWYDQLPSTPLLFPCLMNKVHFVIILRSSAMIHDARLQMGSTMMSLSSMLARKLYTMILKIWLINVSIR